MTSVARPTVSPHGAAVQAAPRARAVFVVTALGTFMASLDLSIVNVAFPDIEASYPAASSASLSWIITAYSIVFGALLVVGGRTGDRLGRKRVFQGGIGVFLLGSILCGIAPNVTSLVAARALQGIGAAFLVPASVALLIAAYPPERRMQIVALWGGIGALAVATGPSLGAAIVSAGGWRFAFFVNIPVGVFVLLAGRNVLAESPKDDTAGRPDYLGVVLMSLSMAALVLAVSEGSTWGWADARILSALAIALVGGAVFVHRTRHHDNPVIDPTLFASPSFVLANTATVVYAAGFFAMLLGNILFLTGVWGYSIMSAGLAVTPGPLVVAVVAGPAGKLAARTGFRPVLLFGATCFAAGLASYIVRVEPTANYLSTWLPGTLLVGLGIGFTFPVLSAGAVSSLPPARFAVGSAVNQTARQIGGALGIATLVALIGSQRQLADPIDGFKQLWLFAASTAIISGVIGSFIPRPTPTQAAELVQLSDEMLTVEADALPLDVDGP